jgi:hypothetical protein
VRVRQANLAAPLRVDPADNRDAGPAPGAGRDSGRSPEQIRAMMGSYQKATERGRREAELAMDPGAQPPSTETPVGTDDDEHNDLR